MIADRRGLSRADAVVGDRGPSRAGAVLGDRGPMRLFFEDYYWGEDYYGIIVGWHISWLFLFQFSKMSDAVPVSFYPRYRISGKHAGRPNSLRKFEVTKR